MEGLYEGDRLAAALEDARARSLGIYAHLDLETLQVPRLPLVNPPVWELAHIAWFQEYWCRRYSNSAIGISELEGADELFDSSQVPHDTRWSLRYPSVRALRRYIDSTLDTTLAALESASEEERYFFRLALLHEDMHGEALLMTLQTLALPAPEVVGSEEPPASIAHRAKDVAFEGGELMQGVAFPPPSDHFVFDNEKWAHPVHVAPFAISDRPLTQREFAAFTDDGGYAREDLWTSEGWAWRAAEALGSPRYWRRIGHEWQVRRFDRWFALDPHAPVVNLSLHEALAYCRWARRRLPTESEWEFAATNGGKADRYPWGNTPPVADPNLDFRQRGPTSTNGDAGSSRRGIRQMIGGVWEWTSTPFAPYPGFTPDPYRDYSQPWFHSHFVLRGGSFATRSRLVHNRFRNFYLPHRGDAFAGFRTCALE